MLKISHFIQLIHSNWLKFSILIYFKMSAKFALLFFLVLFFVLQLSTQNDASLDLDIEGSRLSNLLPNYPEFKSNYNEAINSL